MKDQFAEIRTHFLAALERDGLEAQLQYAAQLCSHDAGLRSRLDEMLRAHHQSEGFLASRAEATQYVPGAAESLGTQIGPYKLLQQIGEGGMGVVYMAEQTEPIQRKVALKVIKPGMDSRQVLSRFEAERQALALMDHVNIARVLDAGATEQGQPYFVMELVHGVTVTDYCDDNYLSPRERLELFVPVCQAVQHAHQKGIIHRDLKPSNVMVTLYDGKPVPKVIDFGVAKATEQPLTTRTLFTQYGTMVGTLEYMSPEQAETSALGVDTRSDIYSLGVLLYELLTGSTPLSHQRVKEAAYVEVLRMIRDEEPPRPSTRLSGSGEALASIAARRHMEPAKLAKLLRGELDWIVMKTLDKDRSRRYATANGLAADVMHYLAGEPVSACPPSTAYRLRKFSRRNRIVLTAAALVSLALALGAAASAWQAVRATVAERSTREQLLITRRAEQMARRQLLEARLAQANAGRLSRRVGQRFDSLNAVAEAAQLARELHIPAERLLELRNTAIACLALPDLRLAKTWSGLAAGGANILFDRDLKTYARIDRQGNASIRRVADDTEIAVLPATGGPTWPVFSQTGKHLAMISPKSAKIWRLSGPDPILVAELSTENARGVAFSADGRRCAAGHTDGSISLYDLSSWHAVRRLPGSVPAAFLAFRPGDRQLAVARGSVVEVLDLDTEKADQWHHPASVNHVAWRPDGQSLAVACDDSRIYLWDAAAPEKPSLVLEGHANQGIVTAFDHAGDLLASVDWDAVLRLWDPRTGRQLFSAPGAAQPGFSTDDRLLFGAFGRTQFGLWEFAAGREFRKLWRASLSEQNKYHNVSMRFDGRLLAVGMCGGAGLWDLSSGQELAFIELPGHNYALFEPSGSLLTTGSAGLLRWPVRSDHGILRLGPPQSLSAPGVFTKLACSADGRVIASAQYEGALVVHADRPEQPVRLGPHHDVRYVAVSRDGQWVATGSFDGAGVKIWEADSGRLLKELHLEGSAVAFTPDGKWLATTAGSLRLWQVGSWREGPQLRGDNVLARGNVPAFSPDGKIMALHNGMGTIRLVAPETGREYARLEGPSQELIKDIGFSPDGTQLISCNDTSRTIQVWDLRAIRQQLAKMELDWDLPAYPSATHDRLPSLRLEVETGRQKVK